MVTRSKHFADYQCNSSMEVFKLLKLSSPGAAMKKPSEVGQAIVDAVLPLADRTVVQDLSVAPQASPQAQLARTRRQRPHSFALGSPARARMVAPRACGLKRHEQT